VRFDEVGLRYGSTTALDGVSLTVRPGERVALLGPSGAGKSSLMSLANTSQRPTAGHVELFGRPVGALTAAERRTLRRRLGTIDQRPPLPGPLRVVHNVNAGRLAHWSTRRALWSLLRPWGVEDAGRALDLVGIGDKLWHRTDELSGGERQRVALARVLVQGADLVLADEPVASLDPARAGEVLALLVDPVRFDTVVVSLHDVDLALAYFDRVVGLRRGRVLFDLPATDVERPLTDRLYDLSSSR
jgi:phosphonate transport system ATP-binding protein